MNPEELLLIKTQGTALACALGCHDRLRQAQQNSEHVDPEDLFGDAKQWLTCNAGAQARAEFYTTLDNFVLGFLTSPDNRTAAARVVVDVLRAAFSGTLYVHIAGAPSIANRDKAIVCALAALPFGDGSVLTRMIATGTEEAFTLLWLLLAPAQDPLDELTAHQIAEGMRAIDVHGPLRKHAKHAQSATHVCARMKCVCTVLVAP